MGSIIILIQYCSAVLIVFPEFAVKIIAFIGLLGLDLSPGIVTAALMGLTRADVACGPLDTEPQIYSLPGLAFCRYDDGVPAVDWILSVIGESLNVAC